MDVGGGLHLHSVNRKDDDAFIEFPTALGHMAVNPEGLRAAAASDDEVVVWSLVGRNLEMILAGHQEEVNGLKFNGAGTQLASSSEDKTVRVWDCVTGLSLAVIELKSAVYSVDFTGCGKAIACDIVGLPIDSTVVCSKPLMILL